jgi:hypothetical protein
MKKRTYITLTIEESFDQENNAPTDYVPTSSAKLSMTNRTLLGEIVVPSNFENTEDQFFEVEYDLKSGRPSMSPLFNSPANSPKKRYSLNEVDSKTPTLADWKLSDATRALVGRGAHDHWTNAIISNDNSVIEDSCSGSPPSPSDLNLSMTTQMFTNIKLDDISETPIKDGKLTVGPHSLLLSPDTPGELTPFRSYNVQSKHDIVERSTRMSLSPDSRVAQAPLEAIYQSHTPFDSNEDVEYIDKTTALLGSMSTQPQIFMTINDVSSDDEQSVNISPLKVVKLLKPRSAANSDGKIPAVQEIEWASAPAFLQKQVTVDMLNTAVRSLNQYLESMNEVETISQKDMSTALSVFPSELTIKTVVMALVYLKRLDISTEGGLKQYKVKAFY